MSSSWMLELWYFFGMYYYVDSGTKKYIQKKSLGIQIALTFFSIQLLEL